MNQWIIDSASALVLASGAALATPHPPPAAAGNASPASALDEESIMSRLQPDGFVDFNDYKRQSNDSAIVQAINVDTGKLETITVTKSGKVSMEPGWLLTQPASSSQG